MKKLILLILALVLTISIIGDVRAKAKRKLVCGIILTHMAVSPTAILEGCKPFANYISRKIDVDFQIEIVPDVNYLIKGLENNTIQMGYVSNLDYVKIKKSRHVTPFAKVVKGGTSTYNAKLLVRKDSGINKLSDLKGKKFAYSSKNSSHGYLYPYLLIKKGFNKPLEKFFGSIITTKKDPDGILSVLYRRADVVSASSQTFAILTELMPRLKRELKVLSTSQPLVHGPMFFDQENVPDQEMRENIKREVLNMSKGTEGKQILLLFKIGGFTSAKDCEYNSLRTLLHQGS